MLLGKVCLMTSPYAEVQELKGARCAHDGDTANAHRRSLAPMLQQWQGQQFHQGGVVLDGGNGNGCAVTVVLVLPVPAPYACGH